MFAPLFPLLSSKYRLIAPDLPGFGHSDAPPPERFAYTFDHLATCIEQLLDQLGIQRCALYLQDYGGPVGFRIAAKNPARVGAIVIQNAVVHAEGLSEAWAVRKAFWQDRAAHEEKIREALLSPAVARQRHLAGAADPERVNPDTWTDELGFLSQAGMAEIQLDLAFDYQSNVAAYPRWQTYLREHRPPTLVVWGRHDPLFTIAGAMAYARELHDAEIHLLNASHFALDERAGLIAVLVSQFLDRRLEIG
jgi:pimeloyl-ACP methyl ester carboxylesterase